MLAGPATAFAAGSISGTVTAAAVPHSPLAGVEVCARRVMSYEFKCTGPTDASGEYTVTGLNDGEYRVEFVSESSSNYVPQYFDGKSSWEDAEIVEVEGGDTPGIDAALAEGGWIEGHVLDSSSEAGVTEVRVCASPIGHEGFSRCASTGASGDYKLLGLATDSYMVSFVPEEGGVSVEYLWQFYKGKSSWFDPTPVTVSVGLGTAEIDAAMEKGGRIAGTVTDAASGAAIGSIRVCLFELEEDVESGCAWTDGGGHYAFERLPRGSYKVWFSPDAFPWGPEEDDYFQQYYNGKPTLAQADTVLLGSDGSASGIDARLVSRKPLPAPLAAPASIAPSPIKPRRKPLKHCRKGQRKAKRRGKVRCVTIHHPAHRRSQSS